MPELTQAIPVIATDAPVARHRRPCIVPALHEPGDLDVPPVARAVGAEAYRRQVDAMAHDRAHGIAQADAMRDARRRRARALAADVVRDLDGRVDAAHVAGLVLDALERDGVL